MNAIIESIFLSLMPVFELRGGIPFAIISGIRPLPAFFICIIANFFVIPIVFFFLDHIHKFFMKINLYKTLFNKYINSKRKKIEKHIGTKWEFIVLMLFVGIPLPITGAYTGTIVAWFFGIERKKAYLALSLGIIMAGMIVTLVSLLGLEVFSFFVKGV